MKDSIKRYAARVAIAATREASRVLPKPTVLTPDEIEITEAAIKHAFDSQWYHFGIVDNWYTKDDIRWFSWDKLARAKIDEIRAQHGDKRLINRGGEHVYL